jgi:hypothetical protein
MTRALPTRAEIETKLLAARADLIACEDHGDAEGAELARCTCDSLLEQWAQIPAPRTP